MNELFETPETLSPKMKWLRKHGISTIDKRIRFPDSDHHWWAWFSEKLTDGVGYGYGETEEESVIDLAEKNGIKPWNQL